MLWIFLFEICCCLADINIRISVVVLFVWINLYVLLCYMCYNLLYMLD